MIASLTEAGISFLLCLITTVLRPIRFKFKYQQISASQAAPPPDTSLCVRPADLVSANISERWSPKSIIWRGVLRGVRVSIWAFHVGKQEENPAALNRFSMERWRSSSTMLSGIGSPPNFLAIVS